MVDIDSTIRKAVNQAYEAGKKSINLDRTIRKAVNEAVSEAYEAGWRQAEKAPSDAFKATERRLRAMPDLRDKLEADKERLQNLTIQGHSKDIIRFQRSGRRLSNEELLEALAQDLRATIAANEHEIKTMETALEPLQIDEYYPVIEMKYWEQKSDDEIAVRMNCDPRTVRRNKSRLVRRLAVRLYGVNAI